MDSVAKYVAAGVVSSLGIASVAIAVAAFAAASNRRVVDDLRFGVSLAAGLGFIINPVKFVPEYATIIVPLMDIVLASTAQAWTVKSCLCSNPPEGRTRIATGRGRQTRLGMRCTSLGSRPHRGRWARSTAPGPGQLANIGLRQILLGVLVHRPCECL